MGQVMVFLIHFRRNVAHPFLAKIFCVHEDTSRNYFNKILENAKTNGFIEDRVGAHLWTPEKLAACRPEGAETLLPGVLLQNDGNYYPVQATSMRFSLQIVMISNQLSTNRLQHDIF